jgi:hypothetical protein
MALGEINNNLMEPRTRSSRAKITTRKQKLQAHVEEQENATQNDQAIESDDKSDFLLSHFDEEKLAPKDHLNSNKKAAKNVKDLLDSEDTTNKTPRSSQVSLVLSQTMINLDDSIETRPNHVEKEQDLEIESKATQDR